MDDVFLVIKDCKTVNWQRLILPYDLTVINCNKKGSKSVYIYRSYFLFVTS